MSQAFVQSFQALPSFFWSARWGMLALGVLGISLALVDDQRARIDRPWRDSLGFIVTMGVVGAVVIAFQYANRESLQAYLAGQPGLITQQGAFLVSDVTLVLTGLLITFGLGYIVWAAWHWWFERWARWLKLPRPALVSEEVPTTPAVSSDDWRTYQDRLMRLKRNEVETPVVVAAPAPVKRRSSLVILAPALLVMTLAVYGCLQLYHSFGSNLITGEAYLATDQPSAVVPVSFDGVPQQINISNINGTGSVEASLSVGAGTEPQRAVTLQLPGITNRFASAQLDVTGLPPGVYTINLALQGGEGGSIVYVVLEGGGAGAIMAALLLGLTAGIWLVLLFVLGYEILATRTSRH